MEKDSVQEIPEIRCGKMYTKNIKQMLKHYKENLQHVMNIKPLEIFRVVEQLPCQLQLLMAP